MDFQTKRDRSRIARTHFLATARSECAVHPSTERDVNPRLLLLGEVSVWL